jgi:hypothetical protein
MAINLFTGATNSNWGTSTNWSLGIVPLSNDGHIVTLNATSPNCIVNASARSCTHIDFTGYTNTFTRNNTLAINGNMTLSSAMTFAGTSSISIIGNSNVTTNGKSIPNTFQFGNSSVMNATFLDTFNCSTLNFVNTGSITFAGSFGFNCSTLNCTINNKIINLASGIIYNILSGLTLTGSNMSLNSTGPGALFNLSPHAIQNVSSCNASWINSNGGQRIHSLNAISLSNTQNWVITPPTVEVLHFNDKIRTFNTKIFQS